MSDVRQSLGDIPRVILRADAELVRQRVPVPAGCLTKLQACAQPINGLRGLIRRGNIVLPGQWVGAANVASLPSARSSVVKA